MSCFSLGEILENIQHVIKQLEIILKHHNNLTLLTKIGSFNAAGI